jgi:hypothetical protein
MWMVRSNTPVGHIGIESNSSGYTEDQQSSEKYFFHWSAQLASLPEGWKLLYSRMGCHPVSLQQTQKWN